MGRALDRPRLHDRPQLRAERANDEHDARHRVGDAPEHTLQLHEPECGVARRRGRRPPFISGGAYANDNTFANGVAVPQTIVLVNKGTAAVTLGTITFTDVVGVAPTVLTPPPATLAAGASGTVVLQHTTNVASGSVGYTVNIPSDAPAPFTYRLQGFSAAAAPEVDLKILDTSGHFAQVNSGGTVFLSNGAIGVPRTVRVMVSNFGSSALTLTGTTPLEHVGTTTAPSRS